jgi:glycosyltransferase involved in cell wall biosynthesis
MPFLKCFTDNYNLNLPIIRDRFKIKRGEFIVVSAGSIAPSKMNILVCEAVGKFNKTQEKKIHYVMVGDGDYADDYLDDYIHKTGYVKDADFFSMINAADLVMNLRYPYNGESSATLIQCMSLGKLCVVTDIGWFGELPDDCVIKTNKNIDIDGIIDVITCVQRDNMEEIKNNAVLYVEKYCDPKKSAEIIHAIAMRNTKEYDRKYSP